MPLLLSIALIALGVLVACAPLLADLGSRAAARDEVSSAESAWSAADDGEAALVWKRARAYNRWLAGKGGGGEKPLPYGRQLVYGGTPCLCYLRVRSVGIELPVYRGTSEKALSAGAGHVQGTSLPVGGAGSNCCISAHSGAETGAMFDGLRDVRDGDYVSLHTLGRELGYRVAGVEIVDQGDTTPLELRPGRDLLTLVTCTSDPTPGMPRGGYGVNNRRLVVTCERCDVPTDSHADEPAPRISANARWWPMAAALGAGLSAVACARLVSGAARRRRRARRSTGPKAPSSETGGTCT